MINPSEENLLGYLIRANEEHEQEELAEQIRSDLKLRQDCQLLQTGLSLPAADEEHLDPPPLLAQRTCSLLWNKVDSGEFPKLPALAKQMPATAASDPVASAAAPAIPLAIPASAALPVAMAATSPGKVRAQDNSLALPKQRWHWLDLAVASSVLVVIGGVLSTQILSSKTQAMSLSCQHNLQLTHAGLVGFASKNGNRLPTARQSGPLAFNGVYGPELYEAGFLQDQLNLFCPESPAPQNCKARMPAKLMDLERASPEELPEMQQLAGGTYYFSLGYIENGKYCAIKMRNCPKYILMSDAVGSDNRPMMHHGKRGQNVLFQNGCVKFIEEFQIEGCSDNPLFNDHGKVAPGRHEGDSVLAPSGFVTQH